MVVLGLWQMKNHGARPSLVPVIYINIGLTFKSRENTLCVTLVKA